MIEAVQISVWMVLVFMGVLTLTAAIGLMAIGVCTHQLFIN